MTAEAERVVQRGEVAVAGSHLTGQLDLDHLRGRSGLPMPVQAAEVALRRQLGETRDGAVRFLGRSAADTVTRARFEASAAVWEVEVHTRHDDEGARLTCGVERLSRIPVHDVIRIGRADDHDA